MQAEPIIQRMLSSTSGQPMPEPSPPHLQPCAECVLMSANRSEAEGLRIMVASLTAEAGAALAALAAAHPAGGGDAAAVALRMPALGAVDWSSLALWLLATSTVAAGALWAGQGHLAGLGRESGTPTAKKGGAGDVPSVTISSRAAVGFVLLASAMLVLLFFFLDKWLAYILVRGVERGRPVAGRGDGQCGMQGLAICAPAGALRHRLCRAPHCSCTAAPPLSCRVSAAAATPQPLLPALKFRVPLAPPVPPLAGRPLCPGRLAGLRHGRLLGAAAAQLPSVARRAAAPARGGAGARQRRARHRGGSHAVRGVGRVAQRPLELAAAGAQGAPELGIGVDSWASCWLSHRWVLAGLQSHSCIRPAMWAGRQVGRAPPHDGEVVLHSVLAIPSRWKICLPPPLAAGRHGRLLHAGHPQAVLPAQPQGGHHPALPGLCIRWAGGGEPTREDRVVVGGVA